MRLVRFCSGSIEHQHLPATKERQEKHLFQLCPERFALMCRRLAIPDGDAMDRAAQWVEFACQVASEAHDPLKRTRRKGGTVRVVGKEKP